MVPRPGNVSFDNRRLADRNQDGGSPSKKEENQSWTQSFGY